MADIDGCLCAVLRVAVSRNAQLIVAAKRCDAVAAIAALDKGAACECRDWMVRAARLAAAAPPPH